MALLPQPLNMQTRPSPNKTETETLPSLTLPRFFFFSCWPLGMDAPGGNNHGKNAKYSKIAFFSSSHSSSPAEARLERSPYISFKPSWLSRVPQINPGAQGMSWKKSFKAVLERSLVVKEPLLLMAPSITFSILINKSLAVTHASRR